MTRPDDFTYLLAERERRIAADIDARLALRKQVRVAGFVRRGRHD